MATQTSWLVKGLACSVWAVVSLFTKQVNAQSTLEQTANGFEKIYPSVDIKDAPLEYRQFEKVEITGSSIIRKEQTQALPVQVLTRDDIKRSGMSNLVEILQTHPAMSMVVNTSSIGTTIGGYNAASLKGLPAGTLLLLNGKRLSSYGRQCVQHLCSTELHGHNAASLWRQHARSQFVGKNFQSGDDCQVLIQTMHRYTHAIDDMR